jgi:hypothetical protein
MSRNGDISNQRQNKKEEPSKEVSSWLQRLADRLKPFTARSTIQASMPPLSSHTRQQLGHAGEADSRLATWVTEHSRLASVLSRAIQMPLLSRALDSIWRKPTFVPSVWQRMLDLPWFRQNREQQRSYTAATGTTPEGKLTNTVSLRSERYPNTLIQAIRDAEEERLGDEADGTYSSPAHDVFSPPIIGRGRLAVTDSLPYTATSGTLPVQTKKPAVPHHSNELHQGPGIIREVPPVSPTDVAYPAVIQNLFPSPIAGGRMPEITRAPFIAPTTWEAEITPEAQDTDSLTSSPVRQSETAMPGLAEPSEIQQPEHRPSKDAQEGLTKVSWQPYYSYPDRPLPRDLTPVTQQTTLQRRPEEVRSHTTHEDVGEGQSSPAGDLHYPKAIEGERKPSGVIARQAASPPIANMPRDASKTTSQPVIPLTANRLGGLLSNPLPAQRVTLGKVSRALLHRFAPQRATEISQTLTGSLFIGRQAKRAPQEVEVTRKPDVLNPFTESRVSMDHGLTEGYAEKPLFYEETPTISRPATQPIPFMESVSRKITLPSQQLFESAANVLPSSSYKDAHQPALALPIAPPARPQADPSVARSEELFRYTSDNIPELAHSRNNNVPQLALSPIAGATETNEPTQATAPEFEGEESGERGTMPDIRALAREIYPLIKRMIMVERERRPT